MPAENEKALRDARSRSDVLFATLRPDAWLARPVAQRHRLIFYLGHLEAFDWNMIAGRPSLDAAFEKLFAFGIDPIDDLPSDGPEAWPPLKDIREWIAAARAQVDARQPALSAREIFVATEHRFMHVETLSYLFAQLAPGLQVTAAPPMAESSVPAQRWVEVGPGTVELGLRRSNGELGWCNESEGHSVHVGAFAIESRKTTNGDWVGFVEAGGYHEKKWWSDASWAWREKHSLEGPQSWVRSGSKLAPQRETWPVYVSHAEASAYAKYRSARLPTEAEWHRAVHGTPEGKTQAHPWGDAAPEPGLHGNFGFASTQPESVGAHPAGASAFGLDEPVGNGWEWTSTVFAPFDGFERLAQYPAYSAPFFDGAHFVLLGASAVTAPLMVRRSFRNWFQPHYRAPFATVRLARERS